MEWSGYAVETPDAPSSCKVAAITYETSRVLITSTFCSNLWISGGVVYGEPPGIKHPDAWVNTNTLLLETLDHLLEIGGLRFVAGDFNFEQGTLEAFANAGFKDIQDLAAERWGTQVQMTCKQKTRKDFCYLSPELQSLLVGVEVDHTIWADHATLLGRFQGGQSMMAHHHWRMPREIEWPQDLTFQLPEAWYECPDPSQQYEDLGAGAEQAVNSFRAQQGTTPLHPSSMGRAHTREVSVKHSLYRSGPVRKGRAGDIQPNYAGISQQHAHWFRQLRRLQSYCRFRAVHATDTDQSHGASLWRSILCGKGFQGSFRSWWHQEGSQVFGAPSEIPLVPPSSAVADKIYESFQLDVRKLEKNLHAKRRQHAVSRRAELAHLVFKDIQRQSPGRIDLLLKTNKGKVTQVDHQDAIFAVDMEHPLDPDKPVFVAGVKLDVIHIHMNEVCVTDAEAIKVYR